MPRFDLEDDAPPTASAIEPVRGLSKATITWSEQGTQRTLSILAQAVVEVGRKSENDLCLRLEPTADAANAEKTFRISAHQFTLRYLGDRVEIIDKNSTNGTIVEGGEKLEPIVARVVESTLGISVANVLDLSLETVIRPDCPPSTESVCAEARNRASDSAWLQAQLIGDDKPGKIAFLRIRRTNNLSETGYAVLFHSAAIAVGQHALLPLPASPQNARRIRALDIGGPTAGEPARLLLREGRIFLERTGDDDVTLGGIPVEFGKPVALSGGADIVVAGVTFHVQAVK